MFFLLKFVLLIKHLFQFNKSSFNVKQDIRQNVDMKQDRKTDFQKVVIFGYYGIY